jgi:undecaprenyl pyrophosphate phosphatase UppP
MMIAGAARVSVVSRKQGDRLAPQLLLFAWEIPMMPLIYLVLTIVVVAVVVAILAQLVNKYIPMPENLKRIANVVLALIVVGMALWLINTYVPMAESIRTILNIVVVIATCVGVLQAVGLWSEVVRLWNNTLRHRIVLSRDTPETTKR